MSDSKCLIGMLAHDLSMHNVVNTPDSIDKGGASFFSYKSMFPSLREHTFIRKNIEASPFAYLQPEVFCILPLK